MTTLSNAGSKFYISADLPATEDQAGYEALTFTQVGEVTDFGTIGAETNLVSYTPVDTAIVNKRKGSVNYGTESVSVVLDEDDPGQLIFEEAAESPNLYSMKIEKSDGSARYYQALVMGYPETLGTVDDMIMVTVPIEVSTKITKVAAP